MTSQSSVQVKRVCLLFLLLACVGQIGSLSTSSSSASNTAKSTNEGTNRQNRHATINSVYKLAKSTSLGSETKAKIPELPNVDELISQHKCYCMEKRNCTRSRGEVYSYCGTSDIEVCCLLPSQLEANNSLAKASLKPDELLNLLTSSSKVEIVRSKGKGAAANQASGARRVPCGRSLNNGTVDSIAQFKEWPWHVAILEAKGDLYICGGSFLENNDGQQFVLTAGHCVINYAHSLKRLKVRLGEYDVSTNSEALAHVEVLVKSIEVHPRFKNAGDLQNDIAVLRLNNSIRLQNRDNIRPVCLPDSNRLSLVGKLNASADDAATCVVTGWGRKYEHSQHSVILKEVHVPVWEHRSCENKLRHMFGPQYTLPTTVICAGDEDRDACDGDGGGPLVCFDGDKWIQQGIVSWGIGCGRNNPGIYTRISSYLSWIKSLL